MRSKSLRKGLVFLLAVTMLFSLTGAQAMPNEATGDSDKAEILIGFESAPNPATYSLIRAQGWEITGELLQINVLVVTLPSLPDELPEEAAERVKGALYEEFDRSPGVRPEISFVEKNGLMYAHGQITPWGVERIGAVEAHDTSTGDGVGIAILDTGIDPNHETLTVTAGHAVVTCSGDGCTEPWDDDHGHGTHVAGTAAALDTDKGVLGVAPNAGLYAVKVLNDSGEGTWEGVAKGIIWAADEGIEVINMSLGGGHSDTVQQAVIYADNEGSLLVASAGNSGPRPNSVNYPAAYKEVIAVSATDSNDNIARWSSRGEEVELAAPGVDILSTVPDDGYDKKSGTSMAAPHVSGVAALVWATNAELTNVDVRGILQESAEDIGLDDTEQGCGLINAAAAVGVEVASVSISPSSQEGEALPGDDAVYDFTVENTGDTEDTYAVSASSEWVSSVDPTSVTLSAGESTTVSVTHSIPEDTSAGDTDTGTVEAVSEETGASASAEFTTTARGHAVEITPESQEDSGVPGDTVEYVYTVSNTGTEDDSYNLEITDAGWETKVSYSSVTVAAGESVEITVSHTIPDDAEDDASDKGTLTAVSQADDTVSASATFTTTAKTVTEAAIISIEPVEWWTQGGRNDDRHLRIKLTLIDEEGDAVSDATVEATLKHDDDGPWEFSETTDGNGEVTFGLNNAPDGNYELKVVEVNHDTLSWDEKQPGNSTHTK